MALNGEVLGLINKQNPQGNLAFISKVLLPMMATQPATSVHSKGVSLDSRNIAKGLGMDADKAFNFGLLHDFGKYRQKKELYDNQHEVISDEEFRIIKKHAWLGYFYFKDINLELALTVGSHHAVYEDGYGITLEYFPHLFGKRKVKEILSYSAVTSIADFINSFKHRKTLLKDDPDRMLKLPNLLREKYHLFPQIVEKAIELEVENK